MTKYTLLKFKRPSHWKSCHLLLSELEICYHQAFSDVTIIEIDLDQSNWEDSCTQVEQSNPDIIIFADHRIRIPLWINQLKQKLKKKVSWSIHAYGCFTGRVDEWMQLTRLIPDEEVKIIAGSETHAEIIRTYFNNPQVVETLHFPYLEEYEIVERNQRSIIRRKYHLDDADLVFTYAGRISFQKNVHHLIKLFREASVPDKKIKLLIAGASDDQNPREIPYGYYLNHAAELFRQELSSSNLHTTYLGELSSSGLAELYSISDYVVSLSTFYGEDYGRSVVEGLGQGLGVIATRWGGHKDLAVLPHVKLIDVILENGTLKLDQGQLEQYLAQACPQNIEVNVQRFREHFGLDPTVKRLQNLYQKFTILGDISREAVLFDLKDNRPWKGKEFFNLHEKVLQPYWK